MKKKIIIVSSIIVVVAIPALFFLLKGSAPDYQFRFEKVSRGDMTVYVTATGTINAVTSVDVGTQVSGIISKLYADFNSIVQKGQMIAQIDTTFLQQSVRDAEASLERAKSQFNESKRAYERIKALYEKQLESGMNYDAALTNYESAQASLKQAMATLDRAKINLSYANIYAPITGVVIDRKVMVGQTVAASFSSPTLFTIANDLSKMQVQATVDESDIGRISIGQSASFTVDAYPEDRFSGTVSQIRLAPVNVQNVVNYIVIIDVNNDELKLMPGMTANVRVLVANTANVLRVPNMALQFQPPQALIDTVKLNQMREMFMRSRAAEDSAKGGASMAQQKGSPAQASPAAGSSERRRRSDGDNSRNQSERPHESYAQREGGAPGGGEGGPMGNPEMRKRFKAVRDSIVAAHGGSMSQEDLWAEMQKVFRREFTRRDPRPEQPKAQTVPAARTSKTYGIEQRFPEYQKSSYVASHRTGRARVWILNADKKLEPIMVWTGINDGKYTEITSDKLKEGDQLVLGVTINGEQAASQQNRNPLSGQQQGPGGGGRPGGGFGR